MGDVRVWCIKYFSLDSLMQDCSLFTPGGDKGKPRSSRLLPRSRARKSPTTAKLLEDHISHSRVFFLLLFTFSVFLCVCVFFLFCFFAIHLFPSCVSSFAIHLFLSFVVCFFFFCVATWFFSGFYIALSLYSHTANKKDSLSHSSNLP